MEENLYTNEVKAVQKGRKELEQKRVCQFCPIVIVFSFHISFVVLSIRM